MSEFNHKPDDEQEKAPIQIDLYGVEARGTPRGDGEPQPKTWREVWDSVHTSLKSTVADTFKLVALVPRGLGNAIRGICNIPVELAQRIARTHAKVDRAESSSKKLLEAHPPPPDYDPSAEILKALTALQAKGLIVGFRVNPESNVIEIMAVRPELVEEAQKLIAQASEDSITETGPPGNVGDRPRDAAD